MTVENSLGSQHSSSTSEPSVTESDQQLSVVSIANCSSSGRATSTISLPPEAKRSKTLLTKRQSILIQNSWKRAPKALGRRHALLQGRGFIPEYWDTFEDAMVRTVVDWEGGVRSCETLYCWKYLVRNFIPLIPLNGTRIMLSELCIPKKVLTKKFSKLIGFIFTDKIDCETVFI
ncbi:unnamed protein product [Anisakis simplex]|uniref:DUF1767 domain-containing protein n=1 Tax=Anisakis simplex TaxID=6269 RepID=A0A0M3KFW5_ANISI|nr:unnamed protein product [Anisakis simplex]